MPQISLDQRTSLISTVSSMGGRIEDMPCFLVFCDLCAALDLRIIHRLDDVDRFAVDPASMPEDHPDKLCYLGDDFAAGEWKVWK